MCLTQRTGCYASCHDSSAVWTRADIGQTCLQTCACTGAETVASVAGRAVNRAVRLAQRIYCTTRGHDRSTVWTRADIGQACLKPRACARAETIPCVAGRAVHSAVRLAQ
eukprot:COSAG01_NODE_7835_length_3034_cov_2.171380_3_plen_110_part_00